MRKIKIILISLLSVMILIISSFFIYVNIYYKADDVALEILKKRTDIIIDGNITYIPSTTPSEIGFIFYPGAKVESYAYLPLLDMISNEGINVYLVTMPFNLAFFGANKAEEVINNYDNKNWFIGGHSLGGAFASSFASNNQDVISAVVLLGAYLYGDFPIEKSITIYGENDLIMSELEYDTNVEVIIGGNHAYFGSYGEQKGDGVATISNSVQCEQTTNILVNFIEKFC